MKRLKFLRDARWEIWKALLFWIAMGMPVAAWAGPVIDFFSPGMGAPGTSVTVTGSGLTAVKQVFFNNTEALFSIVSDAQMTATVPLDATSGPVGISSAAGFFSSSGIFYVAPRIESFDPARAGPGATVTLTGANFEGTLAVYFNDAPAPNFFVVASTQIHVVVPAGASSGKIRVVTPVGAALSGGSFQVSGSEPVILDFNPRSGLAGTAVTIDGENFQGTTAVLFNGTAANFSVVASTQIQTVVPAGAATGLITVVSPAGRGASAAAFSVSAAPVISNFSPLQGRAGTEVVIDGVNFLGATAVQFNGTNAARFTVVAPTQIRATVPDLASSGPIRVVTPAGAAASSNLFLISAAPVVEDFTPSSGMAGTRVILTGRNFLGAVRVRFGGTNAPDFAVTADSQIAVTVPEQAPSGVIAVETQFGIGLSASAFRVTSGAPEIESFQPKAGGAGTLVTIEGSNFGNATEVRFNGVKAVFRVNAPTQVQAIVPEQTGSGFISITTPFGTGTSSNRFLLPPRLAGFTPTNGLAGTVVTLSGTNLTDIQVLQFGGVAAPVYTNSSPGQVTVVVPIDAKTGSLSVLTGAGLVSTTNFFFVLPQIFGISPLNGPEGTLVTINGSGLDESTMVRFNGLAADFRVRSATQLEAIVPARATSGGIQVTTPYGEAASPQAFHVGEGADLRVYVRKGRANQVSVSWPKAATNWVLESSDRVNGSWSAAAGAVVVVGEEKFVTVDGTNRARFFRLKKQP